MKKIIIIFVFSVLIFLTSCTEDVEAYSINVDVKLHVSEYVEIAENTLQLQLKEIVDVNSDYSIDKVEVLISDYAVFPYESEIIENNSELTSVIQDFFNQVSDTDYIGGSGVSFEVGLKAKTIITMNNINSEITCEFFQNTEGDIVRASITYVSDGIAETRNYTSGYQNIFDSILDYT